jgi:K+/H+ antiporter YhaU regulatory subunit KhtT
MIAGLLVAVLLTMIVNRIATVALTLTGMSKEMARFQARSAFSTSGFTTAEAESIVNHPVRRRIVFTLMFLGNAGFIVVIATLAASFSASEEEGVYSLPIRFGILAAGLFLLWMFSSSKWVDDKLFRVIGWALAKWSRVEVHDFVNLLQLGEAYSVTEILVESQDWLVGKRLEQLRLSDVGVNVLGIHRADGDFVGSPVGITYIRGEDKIIVYGSRASIIALDSSRSSEEGEVEHRKRVGDKWSPQKQASDERAGSRDAENEGNGNG